MPIQLPAALEPFRTALSATQQAFVRLVPHPARACEPWESKVGGVPYLPQGIDFPKGPDGRPLYFLAQINFEDMPRLAPFPEHGIVQFYIHDDDLYGMDFDDGENQDTFRVLYFPEVVRDTKKLQSPPLPADFDLLPHHPDESYPLGFAMAEAIAPATDYRFAQQFGASFFQQFGDAEWTVLDEYSRMLILRRMTRADRTTPCYSCCNWTRMNSWI
jgi:uncharacterized protein YwqG